MMWLAVALGGAIGAMSRYAVSVILLPPAIGSFPWATLMVNLIGSALIGVCYVLLIEKGLIGLQWRPFLMVGILGAFTTFSTFALDAILLWQQGQGVQALIYTLVSIIGCLIVAVGGLMAAQKFF